MATKTLGLIAVLFLALGGPGVAQDASDLGASERGAIRKVIESQLAAFQRDDAAGALRIAPRSVAPRLDASWASAVPPRARSRAAIRLRILVAMARPPCFALACACVPAVQFDRPALGRRAYRHSLRRAGGEGSCSTPRGPTAGW